MDLFDAAINDVYVPSESGDFISERHARIAEIIREYNPTLEVQWIPPRACEPGDKMFRIICNPVDKAPYVIMHCDDLNEDTLASIYQADNKHGNVLERIDAFNAAKQVVEIKRQQELAEERADIIKHIIKSPLGRYKHNGVIYE